MAEPVLSYPGSPAGTRAEVEGQVIAEPTPAATRMAQPAVEEALDEPIEAEVAGQLEVATASKPGSEATPRAEEAEAEESCGEATVLPSEPVREPATCDEITAVYEGSFQVETLEDLAELQQIAVVTGDIYLFLPNAVTDLTVSCLQSVGGRIFKPPCSGTINAELTTISFPRLTDIGGELILWYGETLTAVSLPALTTVGSNLSLEDSPVLTELDLSSLSVVGGEFHISQSLLTELSLPSLTEVHHMRVDANEAMVALSLPALHSAGTLRITDNASLASVGLKALTTVTGTLEFTHEEGADGPPLGLLDLNGLETVGGSLLVGRQPNLGNLKLSALEEVGGDFTLFDLDSLSGFVFGSLTEVGGDLVLDANPILAHFCMANLETVGGDLRLTGGEWGGNQHFVLSSVATIGGDLVVSDNYSLEIIPLGSLTTVDGDVVFTGNVALPQCIVDHFVNGLLDEGEIGGEVESVDNEASCKCTLSGGVIPGTCS